MNSSRHSLVGQAIRGAIAGAIATWVMDQITTGIYAGMSDELKAREGAARPNDKPAVANLVDRLVESFDLELDDDQRKTAEQLLHYGLGVVPGAFYAVLRERVPIVGAGRGVLFGLLLFAVNDEYMNTRLGLAGTPDAYPPESHLRGLVGHVTLGMATDAGIDVLGG
jgi:hypothetical protein